MSEIPYPYDIQLPAIKFPPPKRQLTLNPGVLGIVLAVVALCFALANVTIFPASQSMRPATLGELWTAFCFGLIGAEAGLLAIAAVLGPGKGLLRHLIVAPLAMIWIGAWLLGYGWTWWNHSGYFFYPVWKEVWAGILLIPILFCACALPLWIVHGLLRWGIEPASQGGRRRKLPHLSIGGILIATGGVAVALAGVRLGRYIVGQVDEAEWWGACGIAMAFVGGISLFTLPLCAWATLRCRSLRAGVIAMFAWLTTVAFTLVCIISVIDGDWPPWEFWLPFTGIVLGFAFGILGTLSLVRCAGYRLQWGREASDALISAASAAPSEGSPAPQP
jgi:hypothetical protein